MEEVFEPTGRTVVVSPVDIGTSQGGIILPESATPARRGTFVAAGPESAINASIGCMVYYGDQCQYSLPNGHKLLIWDGWDLVKKGDGSLVAAPDHIIVTSDERFNDTMQYGTLTLYLEHQEWNNVKNVKRKLEVFAVSDNVADKISPGEMVFVHFDAMLLSVPFDVDGHTCYKVCCGHKHHMGDVYAVERDGKVVPLFGWALVEPKDETLPERIVNGIVRPEESRKSETRGTVRYIADHDINPRIKPGAQVLFHKDNAFLNDFNGEKLYTMKIDQIQMILE